MARKQDKINKSRDALAGLYQKTAQTGIHGFFGGKPDRFAQFSVEEDGLLLDYSKTTLTRQAITILCQLASQAGLETAREKLWQGENINQSENRPALHIACRDLANTPLWNGGENIASALGETRRKFLACAEQIRRHKLCNAKGETLRDIVNIGIGGSDLGPMLVTRALSPFHDGPKIHFVSNIDPAHLGDVMARLDPARCLFLIASKSFTTSETLMNAQSALHLVENALGNRQNALRQFMAITAAPGRAKEFGLSPDHIFPMPEGLGGRYSVWGAVGLSVAIAIGAENFTRFLAGAKAMDQHFHTTPFARNMPVLLGLVGVWHRNICNYPGRVIVPYDQRLEYLPAYLQQLDMESNGKSVTMDGVQLTDHSGPILWGGVGSNSQHSFFQWLHQASQILPCEFLFAANPAAETNISAQETHHNLLLANCLGQAQALLEGRDLAQTRKELQKTGQDVSNAAHCSFSGGRPSIMIGYQKLTPYMLGRIIALYEHRIFTEAVIWGINPFDQWGVELGKKCAAQIAPVLQNSDAQMAPKADWDSSTLGLLAFIERQKG